MPKFTRKPEFIEAHQWFKNGDHPKDYATDHTDPVTGEIHTAEYRRIHNQEGDVVRYFCHPHISGDEYCENCGCQMISHGWIDAPDGVSYIVCPGDWIVTGIGRFSDGRYRPAYTPWKGDSFESMYERHEVVVGDDI